MLRSYQDIIDRLGPPLWFDDNGAPRYVEFAPDECGVYDTYVAFLLIECQGCGTPYRVASTWSRINLENYFLGDTPPKLPSAEGGVGSFHYGDPPPYCCASGATMNSVPREVLQFWRKDGEGAERFQWRRDAAHEVRWEEEKGWGSFRLATPQEQLQRYRVLAPQMNSAAKVLDQEPLWEADVAQTLREAAQALQEAADRHVPSDAPFS